MSGKGVCCPSRTVLMKGPVSLPTVAAFVALLSSLFHSRPTLADGCPTPNFAPAFKFGTSAWFVTVGDFNADDQPDLLVSADGVVWVLLGNGDGTFKQAVKVPSNSGMSPVSIAVGDFNGDGEADLAVANVSNFTNNISVLLGHGDGTFQPAVNYNYTVADKPQSVVAGDFNGDGKLDLAVAYPLSRSVAVLLGTGDGTFRPAVNHDAKGTPKFIAVADFNGDGRLDLVAVNPGSTYISVLLGSGNGNFQPAVNYDTGTPTGHDSVAVGDFNGDGVPDLAMMNPGGGDIFGPGFSNSVSTLLGKGDGTFKSALVHYDETNFHYVVSGYSIGAGDFNGDGKVDLALAGAVLLGHGDGTFQPAVLVGLAGNYVAVGDFNGDGKPDLAVARDGVSVLLNTCASAGIRLGVARADTGLTLSWSLPYTDFLLESTTSFNSTNWQRAVEVPTTNNGSLKLTAPFDQPARFFRLRKP